LIIILKIILLFFSDGKYIQLYNNTSRKYNGLYGISINNNNIAIRGISTDDGINRYTGCWLNGVWQDWSNEDIAVMEEQISSIIIINNDIYMNGNRRNLYDNYEPGYWKNKEWHSLPVLNENVYNTTYGIYYASTGLIVVGTQHYYVGDLPDKPIGYPDYVSAPGYWENESWKPLHINYIFGGATAYNAVEVNNTLYITGVQYELNRCDVGFWSNGTWNELNIPQDMLFNNYTKCFAYNNDIYIIGIMQRLSDLEWIPGYFKNNQWVNLPYSGSGAKVIYIYCYNDSVYAVGYNGKENGFWENGVWKTFDEIKYPDIVIKAISIKEK